MFTIEKTEGSFTKLKKLRYRCLLQFAHLLFRQEDRFVYFLKSLGMDDLLCLRALEHTYRLDNRDASALIAKLIANPFTEPKARSLARRNGSY